MMHPADVPRLQPYRDRREHRFELARALFAADPERARLLPDLGRAVELAGADRGAIVWLDEYRPDMVHPYLVLDLASDRPRRGFSVPTLHVAACDGWPGCFDLPAVRPWTRLLERDPSRSRFVAFLGVETARCWFLYLDGHTPRAALPADERGRLLFLAGRCSGALMHRDLLEASGGAAISGGHEPGIAAVRLLDDVEGREEDAETVRRITNRFLVARAVIHALEKDLAPDPEAVEYQIDGLLNEIGESFAGDPERHCWEGVLKALGTGSYRSLVRETLGLARCVEEEGDLSGARELYRCAYELAMRVADGRGGLRAARSAGRVCRRREDEDTALLWERVAESLALRVDG